MPQSTFGVLQRVQNAAARLIFKLGPCDHITDSLIQLHWLPIRWRVQYKLVMLMYGIVVGTCPEYLWTIVEPATPSHPGFVRQRAPRRSSSYRVYVPSSVNVPSASPARLHGTTDIDILDGTHRLPESGARQTDKLSKHYWNLISTVKLLIFRSYC